MCYCACIVHLVYVLYEVCNPWVCVSLQRVHLVYVLYEVCNPWVCVSLQRVHLVYVLYEVCNPWVCVSLQRVHLVYVLYEVCNPWVCVSLQRVHQKELPHYIGYLRKALKTVANMLIGEELRGFSLKVTINPHYIIHVQTNDSW